LSLTDIIGDFNRVIDEIRRIESSSAPLIHKNVYKGTRYLLLKGKEKIENNDQAKKHLDKLLSLNENLNKVYFLKEELRELWHCITKQEAEIYVNNWIKKAYALNIHPLNKFAGRLIAHKTGILNFDHFITTGKVEGINNKIKVLKRKAYGFRDLVYFKLRIYFLNEARYVLIG